MSTTVAANPPRPGPKKNRGFIRSIRAALFGGSKKTKMPLPRPAVSSGPTISTIVGSVRPLHVVDTGYSPDRPWMASPAASTSSSGGGGMSSYGSVQSLCDLDVGPAEAEKISNDDGEIDDVERFYDGVEGDEMIDAKAEEFIAKFYQQVRMQMQTPDPDLIAR